MIEAKLYASTNLLTLTNLLTVFALITFFTSLGLGKGISYVSAAVIAIGVFVGSLLWFLLLSTIVILLKNKMSLDWLLRINRITGGLIIL